MLALGQSKHQAKFLSTLSLRRATSFDFCIICLPSYFYPRSPCGERRVQNGWAFGKRVQFLSTLSLRRATFWSFVALKALEFLSTLSLRRATYDTYAKVLRVNISIHALLAESDPPWG